MMALSAPIKFAMIGIEIIGNPNPVNPFVNPPTASAKIIITSSNMKQL
jgi:hypothetical protein